MPDKDYNENLIFHDSDGKEKAILGTLEGECADCINATRNGRHYSDSLWRKVFSNPIVNEMIDNGGIPGEFDHPLDREEVDSARIAILMREKPKEKNGKLWAKFDILNTPLGKIAYTLAKAGFKLGVSSRGSGDTFINNKGEEEVDESTYDFKCFDLVLLPAVKSARLKLVTEGLQNRFDYKQALKESLNSASDKDRKIMESTLDNLGIDYQENVNEDTKINTPVNPTSIRSNNTVTDDNINLDNIDDKSNPSSNEGEDIVDSEDDAAENNGAEVLKDLQEALRKNADLEKEMLTLQEKLSVCYAKEAKYKDMLSTYRTSIKELSDSVKKKSIFESKASSLETQLDEKEKEISQKQKLIEDLESKNKSLSLRKRQEASSLTESLNKKDSQISSLMERVKALNENISSIKDETEKEVNSLREQLGEAKKDALITAKNYSNKISKSNELVEQYKKTTQNAVNKYIDLRASFLGITANEIKNRLPKGYSFKDIDTICEGLQDYRVNLSKLPFAVDSLNEDFGSSKIRMQAETNEVPVDNTYAADDVVDKSLINLANDLMKK